MARSRKQAARIGRIVSAWRRLHAYRERRTRGALSSLSRKILEDILRRLDRIGRVPMSAAELFEPETWRYQFTRILGKELIYGVTAGWDFEGSWIESAGINQAVSRDYAEVFGPSRLWTQDSAGTGVFDPSFPTTRIAMDGQLKTDVTEWAYARSAGIWSKRGDDFKNVLAQQISVGIHEGDSLRDFKKRLGKVIPDHEAWKNERIARTEQTAALNYGAHLERVELDFEFKEWVSVKDIRTRSVMRGDGFDHVGADNQIVENVEFFVVSGERMMFPGDTEHGASAGNTINCRCTGIAAVDMPGSAKVSRNIPKDHADAVEESVVKEFQSDQNINAKWMAKSYDLAMEKHGAFLEEAYKKFIGAKTKRDLMVDEFTKINAELFNLQEKLIESPPGSVELAEAKKLEKKLRARMTKIRKIVGGAQDEYAKQELRAALGIDKKNGIDLTLETGSAWEEQARNTPDVQRWFKANVKDREISGKAVQVYKATDSGSGVFINRSYARHDGIYQGRNADKWTMIHEIGHIMEFRGTAEQWSVIRGFYWKRAAGKELVSLRRLFPLHGFGPDEMAIPGAAYLPEKRPGTVGRVQSHYAMKYYNGATEILSMGFEFMAKSPMLFAKSDPEFFKLIAGLMAGVF